MQDTSGGDTGKILVVLNSGIGIAKFVTQKGDAVNQISLKKMAVNPNSHLWFDQLAESVLAT
jgi:hypothetical protein